MSATRVNEFVSYDGDFVYGYAAVNYWADRREFELALDQQLKQMHEAALKLYADKLESWVTPDE